MSSGGAAPDESRTSEQAQPLAGGFVTNAYGVVEVNVPQLWPKGGCTGSMIARDTVLTAAHCFDALNVPANATISVNIFYFDPEQGKRLVFSGTANLAKYPTYSGWGNGDDLALVTIPGAFLDTDYHDYKRLLAPAAGNSLPDSQRFYGEGFFTADTGVPNDFQLRTHGLRVEDVATWHITTDNGDGIRTCKGDSGGPLNVVASSPSGVEYELVSGVLSGSDTSFSSICASENPVPGDNSYFTRPAATTSYVSWIESTLGHSCTSFKPVGNWPYLRCFDLDFVEDVEFESNPQGLEVAMVGAIEPI